MIVSGTLVNDFIYFSCMFAAHLCRNIGHGYIAGFFYIVLGNTMVIPVAATFGLLGFVFHFVKMFKHTYDNIPPFAVWYAARRGGEHDSTLLVGW